MNKSPKSILDSDFLKLSSKKRAEYVREYYEQKNGSDIYATSPDFNLRELEIDFISKHIKGQKILDLGCGNGYTLLRLAQQSKKNFVGVDFSPNMIEGAKIITQKFRKKLLSQPSFIVDDASKFVPDYGTGKADTVVSERFLLNLPTKSLQYNTIKNIHRLLRPKGYYIMIEGSKNGLQKLNTLRKEAGLEPILDKDKYNQSSKKFNDTELVNYLKKYFNIEKVVSFDLYYIISRIIYPRIIAPQKPEYGHPINEIARKLSNEIEIPTQGIGHVKGYVLRKK